VRFHYAPLFGFRNKNRATRPMIREACTIHVERGVSHAGTKVLGYKATDHPSGSARHPHPGNFSDRSVPIRPAPFFFPRKERRPTAPFGVPVTPFTERG
jgi:hypothetical protein